MSTSSSFKSKATLAAFQPTGTCNRVDHRQYNTLASDHGTPATASIAIGVAAADRGLGKFHSSEQPGYHHGGDSNMRIHLSPVSWKSLDSFSTKFGKFKLWVMLGTCFALLVGLSATFFTIIHGDHKTVSIISGVSSHGPLGAAIAHDRLSSPHKFYGSAHPVCQQETPRPPKTHDNLNTIFSSYFDLKNASFAANIAGKLSAAVQIVTASYDDMKTTPPPAPQPDPDSRREGLDTFREFMRKAWPLTHKALKLELVNRYAIVLTWQGSDPSLKPVMLAAHQDTVPVPPETINQWTYPPFSGAIADGYVWGRGSVDCKAQLTALMEAVEILLSHSYTPVRTIVFGFGFDEEISGRQGAGNIATFLESRYGRHGFEFVLDEGTGLEPAHGTTFAYVSIAEKGYMDVEFAVKTPGGHSSVPPSHTGIGILAAVVTNLEAHPFSPHLSAPGKDGKKACEAPISYNPLLEEMRCAVEHGVVDKKLKDAVHDLDRAKNRKDRERVEEKIVEILSVNPVYKAVLSTTQAVDVISGGVKVNALPEISKAVVNYRIVPDSSIADLESQLFSNTRAVAKKFNMTLVQNAYDGAKNVVPVEGAAVVNGVIEITTLPDALEPSPRTPTDGIPYKLVAGTIRHALTRKEDVSMIVAPSIPTGNSDTRYYHGLSQHIFRLSPLRNRPDHHIHTVNERCKIDDLVASSGFFFELIRNVDETKF